MKSSNKTKKTVTAKVLDVVYVPAKCPIHILDGDDGSVLFVVDPNTNLRFKKGSLKEVRMGFLGSYDKIDVATFTFFTKNNPINPRSTLNVKMSLKMGGVISRYFSAMLKCRKIGFHIVTNSKDLFDPNFNK